MPYHGGGRYRLASRPSHLASVLAGVVVIGAGFAVAVVEVLHFPRGSIWVVVAVAAVLVAAIRLVTARRR